MTQMTPKRRTTPNHPKTSPNHHYNLSLSKATGVLLSGTYPYQMDLTDPPTTKPVVVNEQCQRDNCGTVNTMGTCWYYNTRCSMFWNCGYPRLPVLISLISFHIIILDYFDTLSSKHP